MSNQPCYLVKDVQVACSLCMQFTYSGMAVGPFHIVCDACCMAITETISRTVGDFPQPEREADTLTQKEVDGLFAEAATIPELPTQTYTCRICGDVFLNKGSYARHYRDHKNK